MPNREVIHYYQVDGGKRTLIDGKVSETKPHIKRTVSFQIPDFLNEETWSRHKYSLEDILMTIKDFKPFFLWHVVLLEFIPIANSSCKCSTDRLNSLIIGRKQVASDKLKRLYSTKFAHLTNMPSILEPNESQHSPRLPVHNISSSTDFIQLQRLSLNDDYQINDPYLPILWNGETFIPREIDEEGKIWMNRVQKINDSSSSFQTEDLDNTFARILINDIPYILVEESFFFQFKENT